MGFTAMKVLATKVPDDVYEALKERASKEGMSVATLLRKLIYDYLGLQEGKPQVNSGLPSKVNLRFTSGLPSREEFEELKRRVEMLEKEVKKLAGIGYYLKSRR